jgi:UDP-N-acetylmuramoyl-tripeptide--D-alanyl-D-alanine ligase
MRQFVAKRLAILARQLIAKHKPKIIGIGGSVGKTSARDAIYAVVSTAFWARKGHENYNNELGLPLAILGQKSPGRSAFGWAMLILKGYFSLWFGSFPKVLVLEMGVDKPNDMDYLLSIAKPDIAVITNIGISHYEFFGSTEAVANEEGKLAQAVSSHGAVILNADNAVAYAQRAKTNAKVVSYGFSDKSDVRLQIETEKFVVPVETKLTVHTSTQDFSVTVPAIGLPHIYSCGSAVAVGLYLGLSIENIQTGLRAYKPVPGRLNLINGIRKTLIIDDSYNAAPDSMNEALQILTRLPHQHKVAILGDMLELGDLTESAHKQIGAKVGEMKIDKLITVGSLGQIIAEAARIAGMDAEKIVSFADSRAASDYIRRELIPESAILIKGSQGVRMERISKELLAEPMNASNLLPRQYGSWLDK